MSKKRTQSEVDNSIDDENLIAKKAKVEFSYTTNILSCSDEILLKICGYLKSPDLSSLSDTCPRLARVCSDRSLWYDIDVTNLEIPLNIRQIRSQILNRLEPYTKRLAIKGFFKRGENQETLTPSILEAISQKCPNLEEFYLLECFIDASKTPLNLFPRSIKVLRLKNCHVVKTPPRKNFFSDQYENFPALELLDLEGCKWFDNHSIMSISKLKELKELSLKNCPSVGDTFAYTALACRFGFRKLSKVDLLDTSVGNSDVSCFGLLPELTHLTVGYSKIPDEEAPVISNHGILSLYLSERPFSKIEYLSLTHTQVTDDLIESIAKKSPLKYLNLIGSKVSKNGFVNAKNLMPQCEIHFEE